MLSQLKRVRLPALPAVTWLAWLLPVFAWAPLTYPGYFEFRSGFAPIFDLNDLARRPFDLSWSPSAGQAYDLLRGERALPYLAALFPRALGLSAVVSIKVLLGLAIMAGALGIFGWTRRRFGPWPALLAALVYAFWPFALSTVYERGAVAEIVLLGLLPLALWAADAACDSRRPGAVVALGLSLAAALWTQTGLALWFALILLVYLLLQPDSRRRALWGWLAGLLGGLAGLLPLIVQRGLGGGAWPDFASQFVYPHELLLASPLVRGTGDRPGYQLGLIACGLALAGLILARQAARRPADADEAGGAGGGNRLRIVWFASLLVLLLAFLSTTLAALLWRLLPFLARSLSYPWQLLLLTGPWLAWLAGLAGCLLLDLLPVHSRAAGTVPLFAGLLALALLGSYPQLNPPTTPVLVPDAPLAVFGDHELALLAVTTQGLPQPAPVVAANGSLSATNVVSVTVQWQALQPITRDYTVFFQAIGPDGAVWGQQDTMPLGGERPTSQWPPGQVVSDQYRVALKAGAPVGKYRALLGFYLYQTGERLRTATDDKVVLDH